MKRHLCHQTSDTISVVLRVPPSDMKSTQSVGTVITRVTASST